MYFVMSNSFAAFAESIKVIDSAASVSDFEVKYSIINEWANNKNIQVTVTNNGNPPTATILQEHPLNAETAS